MARLALSESVIVRMTEDLRSILGHIDKLQQLDTENVEPMTFASTADNVLRADEPSPSLPRGKALAAAPDTDEEFFLVPPIIESGSASGPSSLTKHQPLISHRSHPCPTNCGC